MKKLFAFIVVLMFAGFTLAQNTATVVETGAQNDAAINQTGSNTLVLTQVSLAGAADGTANDATVVQNGTGNESTVYQDRTQSPDPRFENVAVVSQTGFDNDSYLEQAGEYGGSNFASVTQISPSAIGNHAFQYQGGYANNIQMYQNGTENFGYQLTGLTSGNIDYLSQVGFSNEAYQSAYGGDDAHITAYQNGQNNLSVQQQSGTKNVELVNQLGNDNKAWQTQFNGSYKFGGVYAAQHNATITQDGNLNEATQWQTENVVDAFGDSRNASTIYQKGNSNISNVYQYEGLNIGNVTQVGDSNLGNITQSTISNTANINQAGMSNNAQVVQQ